MAVDSKQGGNGGGPSPAATLAGVTATGTGANGAVKPQRKKGASQLMAAASQLPSVETSLDEFIAKANSTLVDAASWDAAEKQAKQDDEARRSADSLRWQAAEHQLRESDARAESLRRQLDGLQGKLAEAEARAAVASGGNSDGVIADLKMRLQRSDERARGAEERAEQLAADLAARPSHPNTFDAASTMTGEDADERVRFAEAKAAKAIAVAKAAAAGLNVHGEISAIESGLVVADFAPAKKSGPGWVAVICSLLVGGAVMFAVDKLVVNKDDGKAPAAAQVAPAAAAAPAPAPAAAPAAPVKPVVTPIEDPAAAPAPAAAAAPTVQPIEEPAAPPAPVKAAAVAPAPAKHAPPAPAPAKHAAPAKAAPAAKGAIADPFGGAPAAPAPKKSAPAPKKSGGGGIVDPF